ncbi:hypothetical protein EVAR_44312_1 [Eumeta japonica]|uniref:Uncharacterized protein n=1 Tax=Eumeta variegata TaxID=151549 RepID=A0A4C1WPU7_EUMVA|nr:hypothetical protein EVAR_44312_1 [Eumeta japonica]
MRVRIKPHPNQPRFSTSTIPSTAHTNLQGINGTHTHYLLDSVLQVRGDLQAYRLISTDADGRYRRERREWPRLTNDPDRTDDACGRTQSTSGPMSLRMVAVSDSESRTRKPRRGRQMAPSSAVRTSTRRLGARTRSRRTIVVRS